jgi:hypothetical protein
VTLTEIRAETAADVVDGDVRGSDSPERLKMTALSPPNSSAFFAALLPLSLLAHLTWLLRSLHSLTYSVAECTNSLLHAEVKETSFS